MTPTTIVCVNVGDYCGRGREYVRKMAAGVARNCTVPYRFVCVTDDPMDGVECIPSHPDLKGWWQRMYLYKPGVLPPGPVVYMDLDIIITGGINPLVSYAGPYAMLNNWSDHRLPAGSIMAWTPGDVTAALWDEYESEGLPQWTREDGERRDLRFCSDGPFSGRGDNVLVWSDEHWVWTHVKEPMVPVNSFQAGIYSYNKHNLANVSPPSDATMVVFASLPRPHQVGGWVKERWV